MGSERQLHRSTLGIPQGSPTSPILFILYLRYLFDTLNERHPRVKVPSYIDDIALTVEGNTEGENSRELEKAAKTAFDWAINNAVAFDETKTELMHFSTKRTPNTDFNASVTLPNGTVIKPGEVVRWLGIWLDRKLNFNHHVEHKVAAAKRALHSISRLATSEWGLSASAFRQLYLTCITTVSDFGAEVWWKEQKTHIEKLQSLQNLAMRKILGAFRSSPSAAMEVELSILPPKIRLNQQCRKFAIRVISMPATHPVRQRTPASYPPELETEHEPNPKYAEWVECEEPGRCYETQLIRVLSTVRYILPSTPRVERIDITRHPPWRSTLPDIDRMEVFVSAKQKVDAAADHKSLFERIMADSQSLAIYTDGSMMDGKAGAGVVALHETGLKKGLHGLGTTMEVYDAELFGIERATNMIKERLQGLPDLRHIYIFTDNQAAILKAMDTKPTPGQELALAIHESVHLLLDRHPELHIHLHWVPGHSGIGGNETADELARKGTSSVRDPKRFVSIAHLKRISKELSMEEWNLAWNSAKQGKSYSKLPITLSLEIKPYLKLSNRIVSSTVAQLRLGHGYFGSYLRHLPSFDTNRCQCGAPSQTPEHLLLQCPTYAESRTVMKREVRPFTLRVILGTKTGINALARFLSKTNVATRKWMLEATGQEIETDVTTWGWGRIEV
jgi:ribonuclease HI